METKTISIDISPEFLDSEQTENGGVMWEHNATTLVFNVDEVYTGDYRYYLEYRSLIGTKVRTEYLTLDTETNTVKYNIPVTMSSLKGVECYFNIVLIDEDGNTIQVIKPFKFCLEFDYSPDTDNSLAKVNDFSINALLEAIRLGTFKGDTGEKGDTGDKGDKGDKGDTGEVTLEYANSNYANAIKKTVSGTSVVIDDASLLQNALSVVTGANQSVYVRGKNLIPFTDKTYFNKKYEAGQTYEVNGISYTVGEDGSIYATGTATSTSIFYLYYASAYATGIHTVTLSGGPENSSSDTYCLRLKNETGTSGNYDDCGNGVVIDNVSLADSTIAIVVANGQSIDATFYPMLEFGDTVSGFVMPVESLSVIADENGIVDGIIPTETGISIFVDSATPLECTYVQDTEKALENVQNSSKEAIEKLGYRLINSVTLDADSQNVLFTCDSDNIALEKLNLKNIFILFMGSFSGSVSAQTLIANFNGGSAYQMYKSFSVAADKYYGFWLESEKVVSLDSLTVYKSIFPSALLGNFVESTGYAQGLSNNNVGLYSDISVSNNKIIRNIKFGVPDSTNLIKAGSKIYLFGA